MKRCLVIGAGGCGREVLSWALQMNQSEWKIAGFLDANPRALDGKSFPYAVVGDPSDWQPAEDDVFISGLGDPATRLRVCGEMKSRGGHFATLLHPSVIRALNTEIGEGCVLAPNVVVSANAVIESFVFVNIGASIGHDTRTGQGSTISSHCDLMANVVVGRACFLGSHASVLPGKKVGDGAIVGAGSAVIRNVPPGATVMGVPAQLLSKAKN